MKTGTYIIDGVTVFVHRTHDRGGRYSTNNLTVWTVYEVGERKGRPHYTRKGQVTKAVNDKYYLAYLWDSIGGLFASCTTSKHAIAALALETNPHNNVAVIRVP